MTTIFAIMDLFWNFSLGGMPLVQCMVHIWWGAICRYDREGSTMHYADIPLIHDEFLGSTENKGIGAPQYTIVPYLWFCTFHQKANQIVVCQMKLVDHYLVTRLSQKVNRVRLFSCFLPPSENKTKKPSKVVFRGFLQIFLAANTFQV